MRIIALITCFGGQRYNSLQQEMNESFDLSKVTVSTYSGDHTAKEIVASLSTAAGSATPLEIAFDASCGARAGALMKLLSEKLQDRTVTFYRREEEDGAKCPPSLQDLERFDTLLEQYGNLAMA